MGIFQKITDAILGPKPEKKPATTTPRPAPTAAPRPAGTGAPRPAAQPGATAPAALSEVDVEQRLDGMTGADKLNWRSSIVDLMKLIGVDPSYENRKELAQELGRSDYSGSAEDNIWLHKRTMQELGKHGGKVPKSFLD